MMISDDDAPIAPWFRLSEEIADHGMRLLAEAAAAYPDVNSFVLTQVTEYSEHGSVAVKVAVIPGPAWTEEMTRESARLGRSVTRFARNQSGRVASVDSAASCACCHGAGDPLCGHPSTRPT